MKVQQLKYKLFVIRFRHIGDGAKRRNKPDGSECSGNGRTLRYR